MDTTGSMGPWIEACKKQLKDIISQIKLKFEYIAIRVGFIGYKDHCDPDNLDKNSIFQFNSNIDIAVNFISKQTASGGGDEPEDIAGALEEACKFDWVAKARYAILVADAPCHGKKYHNCHDSYPDGDPKKRVPENYIKILAEYGVNLFAIEINKGTHKMMEIFSEAYKKVM